MFDFKMLYNYESRKVDRYEDGDDFISTAMVSDSIDPYETAVSIGGNITVVETYKSVDDAKVGHEQWVELYKSGNLPKNLRDVGTSAWAKLCQTDDDDEQN